MKFKILPNNTLCPSMMLCPNNINTRTPISGCIACANGNKEVYALNLNSAIGNPTLIFHASFKSYPLDWAPLLFLINAMHLLGGDVGSRRKVLHQTDHFALQFWFSVILEILLERKLTPHKNVPLKLTTFFRFL